MTDNAIAWVRKHPDGTLTDEMLPDWALAPVRRESGAWEPLCLMTERDEMAVNLARSDEENDRLRELNRNRLVQDVGSNDQVGRPPERPDFEAWAVVAGFADRDAAGRIFFHRNGGDGMYDAYCAGAGDQRARDAIACRNYLNAVLSPPFPSGGSAVGGLTQCDMHDDESY